MNNRFKVACTLVRRFYVTSCWLDSNISNCLGSAGDSQCTERRGLESPSFFNTETSGRLTYLEMFQTTKYQFLFSCVWKSYKSLPKCRTADFSCTHNSVLYQLTVPSFTICTVLPPTATPLSYPLAIKFPLSAGRNTSKYSSVCGPEKCNVQNVS